jgi:hypothetical protein
MSVQTDLEKIVGSSNVLTDPETLRNYSQDQSFVAARRPDCVVLPANVEQVQEIIQYANKNKCPVIPFSSGKNLHGATVSDQGGIILNLKRMDKILEVDEKNWFAIIEPGVTYEKLQDELMKKGFRIMIPWGVPPDRSVLTSYLERDPVLQSASFEHGNSLIMDMEMILPEGELFRTGYWATGGRPGGPLGPIRNIVYRLWTGAQGTLGVITKMGVTIHPLPTFRKVFFLAFDSLEEMIEPMKRIQRREIGMECFVLNSFNLAAFLNEDWTVPTSFPCDPVPSPSFKSLQDSLPHWTMIICLQGLPRLPEEKVAYEEEALRETCEGLGVELLSTISPSMALDKLFLSEFLKPFNALKKFRFKGSVHDLTFKSPLRKIGNLEDLLLSHCYQEGYPPQEVGGYCLPMERGRAMHLELDLHCDLNNREESARAKEIWLRASELLMNNGAYFDRPYGPWAEMVYSRAANYTQKLRDVKKEIDPNNILNPGKLCF